MITTRRKEIKKIIEALLFSTSEPLTLSKIKEIVEITYPIKTDDIRHYIEELDEEYQREGRSFGISMIAEGYLIQTTEEVYPYVEALLFSKRTEKLSKAGIEVLAICAYKQPITRAEIEKIRGVDSSGTLGMLVERGLIEITGRLEAPGRPAQYGTTKKFLQHFGLKNSTEIQQRLPPH